MHEVAALCLFATGDYTRAAAILNSLLAAAPGMDWTTLSGLYGNVTEYTSQLRALERHCQEKPDDAAARFVLAYHYLIAGHDQDAATQLKFVVERQPEDQVAKRMLEALSPAEPAAEAPAPRNRPPPQPRPRPRPARRPIWWAIGEPSATAPPSSCRLTPRAGSRGRPLPRANRRSRCPAR